MFKYLYIYIFIPSHTHTYIYVYKKEKGGVCVWEREREREAEEEIVDRDETLREIKWKKVKEERWGKVLEGEKWSEREKDRHWDNKIETLVEMSG